MMHSNIVTSITDEGQDVSDADRLDRPCGIAHVTVVCPSWPITVKGQTKHFKLTNERSEILKFE